MRPPASGSCFVAGESGPLPHLDVIQRAFGHHDVRGIAAHVGGAAESASRAIGAEAYATGNSVAFAGPPSLHTAAHEAAHVVQQRSGRVQLANGVGAAGDSHEQLADQVADAPRVDDQIEIARGSRLSVGRARKRPHDRVRDAAVSSAATIDDVAAMKRGLAAERGVVDSSMPARIARAAGGSHAGLVC